VSPSATLLFLGANPSDTTRLALDREVREIGDRLRASEHRDAFRIEQAWAVRPADLQSCLLRHRPTIVHFSGHGSFSGEILLEDEGGHAIPISTTALATLFRLFKRDIRCVLLNACFAEVQARAIAENVDCVVGMTQAVSDRAAIAFAGAFYQALGYGQDIKTAFELGCNQIDLTGLAQSDVPHLITREGVQAEDVRLTSEGQQDATLASKQSLPNGVEGTRGPRKVVGRPNEPRSTLPSYPDGMTRLLSEQLEAARERRYKLQQAGASTEEVDREIRSLKRQLREGGQLRAGDSLSDGRFLLLQRIGRGGFGTVWRALDRDQDRQVAIKILHSELAGDVIRRDRFHRGVRAMAQLDHQAIVRII
jgi:hypothetical protein